MFKKYILFTLGIAFLFFACDERTFDPVVTPGGAFTLSSTASETTIEIMEETLESVFADFTWTAPDYGFSAAVTYTLEMDVAGNDFMSPFNLAIVNNLSAEGIMQQTINSYAIINELSTMDVTTLEFRVKADLNDNIDIIYSNVIRISIIAFEKEPEGAPILNVPGDYQGWEPGDNGTVIFSRNFDEIYDGYIYFNNDNTQFKYAKGSLGTNWGDDAGDGILEPDGANILTGDDAGSYFLTCDLNTLTHTFERREWGLIGPIHDGGWDTDKDMIWDDARGVLSITLDLLAGEFKFRADDEWTVNFGDDNGDGSMEQDGANIILAEDGNYTIDLILNKEIYTYAVQKN